MWALCVHNGFLVCRQVTRRPCWMIIQQDFFLRNLYEIGLSSQRRKMLLFVSSNVAAMTSRANQQCEHLLIKTPSKEVQQSINIINEYSSIFSYTFPFKYAISTKSHSISQNVAIRCQCSSKHVTRSFYLLLPESHCQQHY